MFPQPITIAAAFDAAPAPLELYKLIIILLIFLLAYLWRKPWKK